MIIRNKIKMFLFECKVSLRQGNGYNPIPTIMTFKARNYIEAKSYFESFGKLLNEPRIISET